MFQFLFSTRAGRHLPVSGDLFLYSIVWWPTAMAINRLMSFIYIPTNFECRVWSVVDIFQSFINLSDEFICRSSFFLHAMTHVTTYNLCMTYAHCAHSHSQNHFDSLRDIFPNTVTQQIAAARTKNMNSNLSACCELYKCEVCKPSHHTITYTYTRYLMRYYR